MTILSTSKHLFLVCSPVRSAQRVNAKVRDHLKRWNIPFSAEGKLESLESGLYTDILIIGGDGTINHTINRLPSLDLPFSIIPAGSGNDYIKSLNVGRTLEEQLNTALEGSIAEVDVGKCNDRLFVNGFGLGFDGQIAKAFEENRTILKGHTAYYYHVLRTLAGYRLRKLRFSVDDQWFDEEVLLLTVAKGTTFGGGFRLTPHARLNDGEFGISLIKGLTPLQRFLNIHRLKDGSHDQLDKVEFFKGKQMVISPQPDMVAHIDGEIIGTPPFEINLLPKKLKVRTRN